MPDYGSGGIYEVQMDGPFSGGGRTSEIISQIVILKDSWKGATSPYSQKVVIPNASVNSKVDIQFYPEDLDELSQYNFSLVVGNLGGEFTAYAVGDKPVSDIEMQISLSDVLNVGYETRGIFGNTISTNKPRADYLQNDPSKADYILNRPTEEIEKIKETADGAIQKNGGTMEGELNMGSHHISNVADPVKDDHAVNRAYVTTTTKDAVLRADGWSATAPYTQTVTVEGLTDNLKAIAYPDAPDNAENAETLADELVKVFDCKRTGNKMTFRCLTDKPSMDIAVIVEVYV